jgi:hypothetical protein
VQPVGSLVVLRAQRVGETLGGVQFAGDGLQVGVVAKRGKARREFDERRVVQTVLDTYASIAAGQGLDGLAGALRTAPDAQAARSAVMPASPGPGSVRRTP